MATLLHLQGLPAPVSFCAGSRAVAEATVAVLVEWPARIETVAEIPGDVVADVRKVGDDFRIERRDDGWVSVEPDDLSVVCTLIVEIVNEYAERAEGLGLLHAGAAAFDGRLILFPASTRAGKSTLMLRLAASGHRVFSDDLIPIDLASGEGVATGCLPRPRLPLPDGLTPGFEDFVDRHIAAEDGYYAYVDPGPALRATYGDRLPVGAVVLLSRSDEKVEARLEPVSPRDALWALVSQDTRLQAPPEALIDDYLRIVADVRCCALVYSDLEDAAACLETAFSGWPGTDVPEVKPEEPDIAALAAFSSAEGIRYRHADSVALRLVGEGGFLVHEGTGRILNLDAIALAVWRLLDGAATAGGIVSIFRQAFPETPAEKIAGDIDAVIREFEAAGLIVEAGDAVRNAD